MSKKKETAGVLRSHYGTSPVFLGMEVRAEANDLLFTVEVTQRYKNASKFNIEALYTFPIPLGAVFLDMSAKIGSSVLTGQIVEKGKAEASYEEAMASGDSAILLESAGPGIYTMNVGNLLPGESADIRYTYAVLAQWKGNEVRFSMPTTLAPRYGAPAKQEIKEHQVPHASIAAEHSLSFSLKVKGLLATTRIFGLSHRLSVSQDSEGLSVCLDKNCQAYLDRDLVLVFEGEESQTSCAQVSGNVVHASFTLPENNRNREKFGTSQPYNKSISLRTVVDCSGSMAGDSISQAREGLTEVIAGLQSTDEFEILKFGNDSVSLFGQLRAVSPKALEMARGYISAMDADMGGTNISDALSKAFSLESKNKDSCVLLITDGHVWNALESVKLAVASGVRVFIVGVGASVSESALSILAEDSGGAYEAVAPLEDIKGAILRQFGRMRQFRVSSAKVYWPQKPEWETQLSAAVFAGDTLHLFAGFNANLNCAKSEVCLKVEYITEKGVLSQSYRAIIQPVQNDILPRVAAAGRLSALSEDEALKLALEHQLLSAHTHYIAVANRASNERAVELPKLERVGSMLAAGWGGVGSIRVDYKIPISRRNENLDTGVCFLRKSFSDNAPKRVQDSSSKWISSEEFIERLKANLQKFASAAESCTGRKFLEEIFGEIPEPIQNAFTLLLKLGWSEDAVLKGFFAGLLDSKLVDKIERPYRRILIVREKTIEAPSMLKSYFSYEFNFGKMWHFPVDSMPLNLSEKFGNVAVCG